MTLDQHTTDPPDERAAEGRGTKLTVRWATETTIELIDGDGDTVAIVLSRPEAPSDALALAHELAAARVMRGALERIAEQECGTGFAGYGVKVSCLEIQRDAVNGTLPDVWAHSHTDWLRNGEHFCSSCRARYALSAASVPEEANRE